MRATILLPHVVIAAALFAMLGCQTTEQSTSSKPIASSRTAEVSEANATPDSVRPTTEEELRKYISDSTLIGPHDYGNEIRVYYKPDGTYQGKLARFNWGVSFNGSWTVKGNEFCSTQASGRNAGQTRCNKYVFDGKEVMPENPSGRGFKRERGNKVP